MGGQAATQEHWLARTEFNKGYVDEIMTTATDWLDSNNAVLTASTAPEIEALVTDLIGIHWDHGDDETDPIKFPFTMSNHWAELQDDLHLVVVARKRDDASDENANLALEANISWLEPGQLNTPDEQDITATAPTLAAAAEGTLQTLTTGARALLAPAAIVASSSSTGFAAYRLDIGRRLVAESKRIEAGCPCLITLAPHEAVGSGDMDLQIFPPIIRWRRHFGPFIGNSTVDSAIPREMTRAVAGIE